MSTPVAATPATSTRPSLFRDIGHYLSGRVVLVLLGFATFPLMTRMLSVSQYGVVSLALRIILLLTVLAKCGLQYSAARFYEHAKAEGSLEQQRRFYSTLVIGPVLMAVAVVVIYLPLLFFLRSRIADPILYRCLLFAPTLVLLRTLQSLLLSLLRNEGRSKLHSILEVLTKFFTLAAFVALLFGGFRTAFAILVATAVSESLVVLLQIAMLLQRKLVAPQAMDWHLIRISLSFGMPLIAYELSSIVLDSGDRLLVRHYLGDIALGYYSAAYNISGYLQDTVMTPLNLAIVPIYMRLWNEEGREATQSFLSTALSWFSVAAIAVTALSILCSRDAIILLASARFEEAHRLLPILIPSLMLYAAHIFLNVGLILQKRTPLMATLVAVSAAINLALNVVLIPRIGLTGAAWATLLSYLLLVVCLSIINQRILPLHPDFALMARSFAAAAVAFVFAGFVRTPFPALTLALRVPLDLLLFAIVLLLLSSDLRRTAVSVLAPMLLRLRSGLSSSEGQSASCDARVPVEATERGRP